MPKETDLLVAMLERGFDETDQARRAAAELPGRLAELRALVRAALHVRPLEINQLIERFPDVARLLPPKNA